MRSSAILVAALASLTFLTGCDSIFGLDNYEAPASFLKGQVVFEGQPVGVRNNGVQLELWQPGFQLTEKIPVHVFQDGTFSANLFDGSYKLNLLANNGPWVSATDTIRFDLSGQATIDFPVTPYYVIRTPTITRNAVAGTNGNVAATFTVGRINTTRAVEYVGLYVGLTTFVDRNNSLTVAAAVRERTGTQIATQLTTNAPITITVPLPTDIYETQSPVRRTEVFVRLGVKTVGVAEMLFSPVFKVAI